MVDYLHNPIIKMTSTTGTTMPRIAKFTHKKDLPFREYTLVVTPTGGDKTYTTSNIISFRIALGNDKLRCIYGPQTYGSFVLAFNLEGLHDSDEEFRSCMPLDGNTTNLTFTTGIISAGITNVDCFISSSWS